MKKLLFLILLTSAQTIAFAQYSLKWQGTDVPGHIQASFAKLTGTQSFKILPSKQKTRWLKYTVQSETDKISIIIKSGSTVLVSKEVTGMAKDSINLSNPQKRMKVSIRGNGSSGSFDIRYSD